MLRRRALKRFDFYPYAIRTKRWRPVTSIKTKKRKPEGGEKEEKKNKKMKKDKEGDGGGKAPAAYEKKQLKCGETKQIKRHSYRIESRVAGFFYSSPFLFFPHSFIACVCVAATLTADADRPVSCVHRVTAAMQA